MVRYPGTELSGSTVTVVDHVDVDSVTTPAPGPLDLALAPSATLSILELRRHTKV